ncbi:MAG: hypothetical protein AAF705_13515 [Bacteroidota bacterium]
MKFIKILIYTLGILVIVYILFGIYGALQFRASMQSIVNGSVERLEWKAKVKADHERFGASVLCITLEKYADEKRFDLGDSVCLSSQYLKSDSVMVISGDNFEHRFVDHHDRNCMACVEENEVVCKLLDKGLLLVETAYYRGPIYQLINDSTGRIDTLNSFPRFSVWHDYFVAGDQSSMDTLVPGLQIWKLEDGVPREISRIGKGWIPIDYYWRSPILVHVKAIYQEEGNHQADDYLYLAINLDEYIDEATVNNVKVYY